ncbi:unnamed protein product [Danaus chrysippus]|uniref:(African queen) hypothetical protein n=1 Tax=Danaus chrysippus TaxID=151541 RepID=A0A8J2R500_9NEOP|nr:unnamed protein product [Danaus chrysippus]
MKSTIVVIFSLLASSYAISQSFSGPISAASQSQIRFAIENKYDDTGPGAKGPEYAYNTYKTLGEALISYLDDPDTKLPQGERERAVASLQIPPLHTPIRQYPKTVEEYTGYKSTERPALTQYNLPKEYYRPAIGVNEDQINSIGNNYLKANDGVRFQRVQLVQSRPSGSVYYKQPQSQQTFSSFNPNPKYSFSYGVHDKSTGDSKSAHETRTDGVVRGYYTFMDADGKQRTVHYTADDQQGFRATVQRSTSNIHRGESGRCHVSKKDRVTAREEQGPVYCEVQGSSPDYDMYLYNDTRTQHRSAPIVSAVTSLPKIASAANDSGVVSAIWCELPKEVITHDGDALKTRPSGKPRPTGKGSNI